MRLARYERDGRVVPAVLRDDAVLFFDELDRDLPPTLEELLAAGPAAMAALRDALARGRGGVPLLPELLRAPLRRPGKFLGIGFNYSSHVEEVRRKGHAIPDLSNQVWFNKQTTCITDPYAPIHMPAISDQLDYECELAVVIGRRCRHVAAEDAHKVIAGYMVTNDVSVRDWQLKAPTATLGKSFDTHGPIGPWITTADEVPEPESLGIRTIIDGVTKQEGNTSEMINGIASQIAYLTQVLTLEPGDILATGTPFGVAAGRTPIEWLKAGQVVRIEIDGLGHIENRVIDEPLAQTTFID